MVLDHLCRNTLCANPNHLEPVTTRVNVLRGESPSAHAARATHCPQGHPLNDQNMRVYSGARVCLPCKRARWHAWKKKRTLTELTNGEAAVSRSQVEDGSSQAPE